MQNCLAQFQSKSSELNTKTIRC